MHDSTIVLLINDTARAIKAEYEPSGSKATFKTLDQDIDVGDMVVVQSGTRHEMTTCKVVEVDFDINYDTSGKINWVIQKIDTDTFEQILGKEKQAIDAVKAAERERKRNELRESMFAGQPEDIKALEIAHITEDEDVTE